MLKKFIIFVFFASLVFATYSVTHAIYGGDITATKLSQGSKGVDVTTLQTFLEGQGFLVMPKNTSKGVFGPLTKKALVSFQKAHRLPPVGIFGPKTKELFVKLNTLNTNTPRSLGKPVSAEDYVQMYKKVADACVGKTIGVACNYLGLQDETINGKCIYPQAENPVLVCGE